MTKPTPKPKVKLTTEEQLSLDLLELDVKLADLQEHTLNFLSVPAIQLSVPFGAFVKIADLNILVTKMQATSYSLTNLLQENKENTND